MLDINYTLNYKMLINEYTNLLVVTPEHDMFSTKLFEVHISVQLLCLSLISLLRKEEVVYI